MITMVTTIPTAIPPPKLPPLNLDFVVVVVVVGLSVVVMFFGSSVVSLGLVVVIFGDMVVILEDVVVLFGDMLVVLLSNT